MPFEIPTQGHDPLYNYTSDEIERMFLAESVSPGEARAMSRVIAREVLRLNMAEQRLWKKVRRYEYPTNEL